MKMNFRIKRKVKSTTSMSRVKTLSNWNLQKIGEIDSGCESTPLNPVIIGSDY